MERWKYEKELFELRKIEMTDGEFHVVRAEVRKDIEGNFPGVLLWSLTLNCDEERDMKKHVKFSFDVPARPLAEVHLWAGCVTIDVNYGLTNDGEILVKKVANPRGMAGETIYVAWSRLHPDADERFRAEQDLKRLVSDMLRLGNL